VNRTMLPSIVEFMALNELQTGDSSEALVPSAGSRCGICWAPSLFS
jgi:hypothetical protein